jgi:hypothetical protein
MIFIGDLCPDGMAIIGIWFQHSSGMQEAWILAALIRMVLTYISISYGLIVSS